VARTWLLVVLLAAGCASAIEPSASAEEEGVRGGTLRVGLWIGDDPDTQERDLLDPQRFHWHPLARCCLLRTLLSYEGRAIEDGGTQLRPDLAEAMPEVSADGLTWTFTLRDGLRYAPPLQERPILARDFVTALERTIRVGDSPYHDIIEGVQEFREGTSGTISGIQVPDDRTIVFRLTEPTGDFGNRLAMPYLAPIPEEALAVHDDDYGGYLVASGPYMIEGAESLRLDDPAAPPTYASDSLALVRNPSWAFDLDPLRPAYVDRIEVVPLPDRERSAHDAVVAGDIHVMLDPTTPDIRAEILADPELRGRLREVPNPFIFYVAMNVAQPPFDDVAVRRAVSAAIDREALLPTFDPSRGSAFGPISHAFSDVAVGGLLRDWAPEGLDTLAGDPDRARELMAESTYDTDGNGICDADACAVRANQLFVVTDAAAGMIAEDLTDIGIVLQWVDEPQMNDPTSHIGLGAILGWAADYPSGNDFAGLVSDPGPETLNPSLVGATAAQLAEWGYDVDAVPSLDDKISVCRTLGGSAAFACWAELDQLLTEQVVAWVPIASSISAYLLGADIDRFEFSGSEQMPALDRITLRREGVQ
jgi:peptide/nickel transport system substrate-binding protein